MESPTPSEAEEPTRPSELRRELFQDLCYAEADGALLRQFRHLHTDIYGNRGELIQ